MDPRSFLESYQVTDIEKDPLPIKVLRNAITKDEIPGQALQWAFEYLDQRSCPLSLIVHIIEKLHHEVQQTDFSHCAEAVDDSLDVSDGVDNEMRFEPLKLMRAIVKKLDEICVKEREDYHDSVDGIVESPDMQPHVFAVSYNNIKNSRRFMEDRMTLLPRMDRLFKLPTPVSYFAVFDGHNGAEAAAYGAAQLHQYLIQSINQHQDILPSISDAFESLDDVFIKKCRSGKVKSGSTVVLSLIMPGKLYVAWLGDSQAVLVKNNEVNNLVTPHKPERRDEIERIRSVGGEVIQMHDTFRVNGNLAVSRAIGDADQKTFIISTPDIKMLELDGSEEFLILACDGLWDEITPESAAQIVRRQVVSDPTKVTAISQKLVQQAKQKGSQDNISVIVVFLEPLESIKNRYEGVLEPEVESEVTCLKQSPEPMDVIPMEKFIEQGVGSTPVIPEMNGHAKEGEQVVDFLSFGSSKESGTPLISDDTGNHSGDENMAKKEVEEELSDAESDDEWQFEKPSNQGIGPIIWDQKEQKSETLDENKPEQLMENLVDTRSDMLSDDRQVESPNVVDVITEQQIRPEALVQGENPDSMETSESVQVLMPPKDGILVSSPAESFEQLESQNTNPFVTEQPMTDRNSPDMQNLLLCELNRTMGQHNNNGVVPLPGQNIFGVEEISYDNVSSGDQTEEVLCLEPANPNDLIQMSVNNNPFEQQINDSELLPVEEPQKSVVDEIPQSNAPPNEQIEDLVNLEVPSLTEPATRKEIISEEQEMKLEDPFVRSETEMPLEKTESPLVEIQQENSAEAMSSWLEGIQDKLPSSSSSIKQEDVSEANPFEINCEEQLSGGERLQSPADETIQINNLSHDHVNEVVEPEPANPIEPVQFEGNNPFGHQIQDEEVLLTEDQAKPATAEIAEIEFSSSDQINEVVPVEPVNLIDSIQQVGELRHELVNEDRPSSDDQLKFEAEEIKQNDVACVDQSNEIVFLQSETLNETIQHVETPQDFIEEDIKPAVGVESIDNNWNVVPSTSDEPVNFEKSQATGHDESTSVTELQQVMREVCDPSPQDKPSVLNGEAVKDNESVKESLSKPSDLVIPVEVAADTNQKPTQEKKPTIKSAKSPTKPEAPMSKGRTSMTSTAAPKASPTKLEPSSKASGLVNGKSNTTVPRSAPKPTAASAPKPSGTKVAPAGTTKTTGASRTGTASATRTAPSKGVNGIDAKSTTSAKPAPSSTMRTRPAPAAPKPGVPKTTVPKTTSTSTTSPKRVPPVGGVTTARPPTARLPTAPAASKVAGEALAKAPTGVAKARPKPAPTSAVAPKPGVPGADVKKPTALKSTATSGTKLTAAPSRPATARTVPMSARTAPPSKPNATANRPMTAKPSPKPGSESSKASGTTSTKTATKAAAAPPIKATTAVKKVDSPILLKSKKPSPSAVGKTESTAKSVKSTINKKVASASSEKAELIQQNGLNSNEGKETVKERNGVNGDINGLNGETEKYDAIKENGVHLDEEPTMHDDSTPPPLTNPPTENLLG